jgi:hypothetical protein
MLALPCFQQLALLERAVCHREGDTCQTKDHANFGCRVRCQHFHKCRFHSLLACCSGVDGQSDEDLAPLIFSPARTAKWHANNFRRFVQRRFFEGGRTKRTNACDDASTLHDKLSELEEIVSSGQSVLNKRACFINDTHFQLANTDQAVCFRLWSFHQDDCHQQNKGSWATTSPDLAPLQTGLQLAKLVCHQTINNERGLISIHSLSLHCLIRGKWDCGAVHNACLTKSMGFSKKRS